MRFTKMQGCGNDYIYVNAMEERVESPVRLAKQLSDRHFGIGADGLILIGASKTADFSMEMYNADGSKGAMCGNGIRCVGKYVYERGLTRKTTLTIETGSGNRVIHLQTEGKPGEVTRVTVEMGTPEFRAAQIPVLSLGEYVLEQKITVGGKPYTMTCLSMGNPHAVVWTENVDNLPISEIGSAFEHLSCFPDRINTEFIQNVNQHTIKMRVWERGSGETLSCGTGACAAAVAAMLSGYVCEGETAVELRGGTLFVTWDRTKNKVFLTGPAETVFEGTLAERK